MRPSASFLVVNIVSNLVFYAQSISAVISGRSCKHKIQTKLKRIKPKTKNVIGF